MSQPVYFNRSQSVIPDRSPRGSASFFPAGTQVLTPDTPEPIEWSTISPFSAPIFDILTGDPVTLVCLIPGTYFAQANINFPTGAGYDPMMATWLTRNADQSQKIGIVQQQLGAVSSVDYCQGEVAQGFFRMNRGDTLEVWVSSNLALPISGVLQPCTSEFTIYSVP